MGLLEDFLTNCNSIDLDSQFRAIEQLESLIKTKPDEIESALNGIKLLIGSGHPGVADETLGLIKTFASNDERGAAALIAMAVAMKCSRLISRLLHILSEVYLTPGKYEEQLFRMAAAMPEGKLKEFFAVTNSLDAIETHLLPMAETSIAQGDQDLAIGAIRILNQLDCYDSWRCEIFASGTNNRDATVSSTSRKYLKRLADKGIRKDDWD